MNKLFLLLVLIVLAIGVYVSRAPQYEPNLDTTMTNIQNDEGGDVVSEELDPLTIELLRRGEYPGSEVTIEQILEPGSNYNRYIASYRSEGLKIYALLTVPLSNKPSTSWPVIIFNHGYIPPREYKTTERYVAYVDGFARNGYIVFKPDYRGHGSSEGSAVGAYGSNAYTTDVLNAVASIKKYSVADPGRIGMWGHSLGGFITLRAMVVSQDIKVGVIWAGVVGSYEDLLNNWRRRSSTLPLPSGARRWRQALIEKYGSPEQNPAFWDSISATTYLTDISGPMQLHHGTGDTSVPILFSQKLEKRISDAGKTVELFEYPGDDHNLGRNFGMAMARSVEFFDKYLKKEGIPN